MLMRFDPFRELDRMFEPSFPGAVAGQSAMPMDAYRHGDTFVVHFDLPGVDPGSIDLSMDRNVLTLTAERHWEPVEGDQVLVSERRQGRFSRQLFLGDGLDGDQVHASYDNGVLTVTIPVAERAKPRRIEVSGGEQAAQPISTTSS
jgi:HSP20 family protein